MRQLCAYGADRDDQRRGTTIWLGTFYDTQSEGRVGLTPTSVSRFLHPQAKTFSAPTYGDDRSGGPVTLRTYSQLRHSFPSQATNI